MGVEPHRSMFGSLNRELEAPVGRIVDRTLQTSGVEIPVLESNTRDVTLVADLDLAIEKWRNP